ncbi:MAG: hypothetical protein R2731_08315 [Nocardioides sp.]
MRVVADVADSNLRIEPSDVVEIDPGGRADLLLQARSSVLGVHEVTLRVADEQGRASARARASRSPPRRSAT